MRKPKVHKWPVATVVEVTNPDRPIKGWMFVAEHTHATDGSPLYTLAMSLRAAALPASSTVRSWHPGYKEKDLKLISLPPPGRIKCLNSWKTMYAKDHP